MATSDGSRSPHRPPLRPRRHPAIGRGVIALTAAVVALVVGGLTLWGLWGAPAGRGGVRSPEVPAAATSWGPDPSPASTVAGDPRATPPGGVLDGGAPDTASLWPPAAPIISGPDPLDLVAKTALVLGLLYLALRLLRRVGAAPVARSGGRLRLLESHSLGPRAALHLVAVGERCLVVGQTPGGLVALAELEAADLGAVHEVAHPTLAAGGRREASPSRIVGDLGRRLRREGGR